MYDDELILPWFEHVMDSVPAVSLFDVHAHVGTNDPDGFRLSAGELVGMLEAARARSVVMPMHEPDGYVSANDHAIAEAAASNGRLVAFGRVDPHADGPAEARRCLDAGARGIKLHPRAEGFELTHPAVKEVIALAHDRRLPVLIHAGRGIPTLGRDAVELARHFPDAPIVLAHAAICDLSWIWREAASRPNIYFDTSWWNPIDLAALFTLVPPGQILYGSDPPYFTPVLIATCVFYAARQLGLDDECLRVVFGGQLERLLNGEQPVDLGPPPGPAADPQPILLERVTALLILAVGRMLLGDTAYEPLALARLACDVGADDAPEAPVCRNVLKLLDRHERAVKQATAGGVMGYAGAAIVMLAANVSRAPSVSLLEVPELASEADIRKASQVGHQLIDPAELAARSAAVRRASGVFRLAPEDLPPADEADAGERDLRRSSAADHMLIDQSALPPQERPK